MSDEQSVQVGKWQRRVLRAVMPAGVLLLVLWIAWIALRLILGAENVGLSWVSAVLGLITSLLLIGTGFSYRRNLERYRK